MSYVNNDDVSLLLGLVCGPRGLATTAATLTLPQHTHTHQINTI